MPDFTPLAEPCDIIYTYDGSLAGFYCCVFESIYTKQIPASIISENESQPSMFAQKFIITEDTKAQKVRVSIRKKACPRALELIENVFLSCLKQKEIALLHFLFKAYHEGEKTLKMLGDPTVAKLLEAERHLLRERHLLLGFIRFSDYGGTLVATIHPKNFILPFIAGHFINRYANENFVIYDKSHKAALVYQDHKKSIVPVGSMDFLKVSEDEENYQTLWKQFYKTIAIKSRINPKLRMTLMPKRYWENMTEMKELL